MGEDSPASSAARAAGQAVAAAHVSTHAAGAAIYALQAAHRTSDLAGAEAAVAGEGDWQFQHLLALKEGIKSPVTLAVAGASDRTCNQTGDVHAPGR